MTKSKNYKLHTVAGELATERLKSSIQTSLQTYMRREIPEEVVMLVMGNYDEHGRYRLEKFLEDKFKGYYDMYYEILQKNFSQEDDEKKEEPTKDRNTKTLLVNLHFNLKGKI